MSIELNAGQGGKRAMLPNASASSVSSDLHEVTAGCDPDGDSLCFDGRFRKIGIQNLNK